MRGLTLLTAAAVTTLMGGVAFGADLMVAPPAPEEAMTSDWTGGYLGVRLEGDRDNGSGDNYGEIDIVAGANLQSGMFLVGLEGWLGYSHDFTTPSTDQATVGIEGRAGFVVGDAALLYGALGYNYYFNSTNSYYIGALGVEFMVSDNMSLDVAYVHQMGAGNPNSSDGIKAQLNWHMK